MHLAGSGSSSTLIKAGSLALENVVGDADGCGEDFENSDGGNSIGRPATISIRELTRETRAQLLKAIGIQRGREVYIVRGHVECSEKCSR
jgi:hypothetical protein